ncbi:MAG: putative toxin-antitoxin system toxin component, PIN family [Nanoarchaeota archaeon]|nr:putative toxin-antitoxin system toxin component, PIN family [Nanoarchaeota archaeon]
MFWELGNPHKIVELAIDNKIKVFTSLEILQELEKILKRDFKEPEDIIDRQVGLVLEFSDVIKPKVKINVIKEDPDDNKILECAVSSGADFMVTGDKHLLNLKNFGNIKIIKAREFLDIINK